RLSTAKNAQNIREFGGIAEKPQPFGETAFGGLPLDAGSLGGVLKQAQGMAASHQATHEATLVIESDGLWPQWWPYETRMLSMPLHDSKTWYPETEEDRGAIREQLGRLLASPVFMRSKG